MILVRHLSTAVCHLSNEQLQCELACAERCAMTATRTRRDAALVRVRCLRAEIERRAALAACGLTAPRPVALSA